MPTECEWTNMKPIRDFRPVKKVKLILIIIQLDATVRRYLFTAKSLHMFRVSPHPSSGVLKTVTAASGTSRNIRKLAHFMLF